MCTSYLLTIRDGFPGYFNAAKGLPAGFSPENAAFPGSSMPVITRNSPNIIEYMQWGLIPSWAKDPKIGKKLFNARAETVQEKPAFRKAFTSQRCIIPASSFFEWGVDATGKKSKYNFAPTAQKYLALAGLYERWEDAEQRVVSTFTMITTEAKAEVAKVHTRMPLQLETVDFDVWLSKDTPMTTIHNIVQQSHGESMSVQAD